MEHLITKVVICEKNRTRAELYDLWLSGADTHIALTAADAVDTFDEATAVAILDQAFAGEDTRDLVDRLRATAPLCWPVETRDRSAAFPKLGLDERLVKPVFKSELTDIVERLVFRANYHLVLRLYYQTTAPLLALQSDASPTELERERADELRRRADRLRSAIRAYQGAMSEDDITAVKDAINYTPVREAPDSDRDLGSKYRPDKCSQCGAPWNEAGTRVTKLGAYVWRCGECGHVQMRADPSHQDVGKYRR